MTETRAPYTTTTPKPCMLAVGNAFDGMTLCGPFDSAEAAADFAETNIDPTDWQIVPITPRVDYYDLTPTRRAAFDLLVAEGYTPERSRGWRLLRSADGAEVDPETVGDETPAEFKPRIDILWRALTQ